MPFEFETEVIYEESDQIYPINIWEMTDAI